MPPELIIFDCDGVLIDSEAIAATVIAENLTAEGWAMDAAESMAIFMGMSIADMEPMIETRLGRSLGPDWRPALAAQLLRALGEGASLVPGARQMLETVTGWGFDWRVASNSSDAEMAVKFTRTGLSHMTEGRTHSAAAIIAQGGRAKPAPDLFLAAAAASSAPPSACLVLEDSVLGVTGAVAAGMQVIGFAPHDAGARLRAAGASAIIHELDAFLGVIKK